MKKEVFFLYRYDIKCCRCLKYMNPNIYEQHINGSRCMQTYLSRNRKQKRLNKRKKYLTKIYNEQNQNKFISTAHKTKISTGSSS